MSQQRKGDRKVTDGAKAIGAAMAPLDAATLERTQIAKYRNTKGGHGFAAEDANSINDRLRGKDAKIVGKTNERNGADRLVDGVHIQSKYCKTASDTVDFAFDRNGNYRYAGQALEVPKDQYKECVELMRKRIGEGQVPGHTNPADAEKIVKKGTVTYKQAHNIARAGNIDSVVFDVKTGAALASGAFGLSFAINYWQACREGMDQAEAVRAALAEALLAGSATLVTHVLTAQLLRTKAAAWGTVAARQGVRAIAHTSIGKTAVEGVAAASLGKAVHGAAAINHVSKLLRSNIVTGGVTTAVMCAPDFYRAAFDNSISWRQFTKNAVVNVAGVAGGGVGAWGCAAAGAAIGSAVPFVGTVAGGIIGGLIGGFGGGMVGASVAKIVADELAPDDSKALVEILQRELENLASEYLLSKQEVEQLIRTVVDGDWLRQMYRETQGCEDSGRRFVRREFEGMLKRIAAQRPKIAAPSAVDFRREAEAVARSAAEASRAQGGGGTHQMP